MGASVVDEVQSEGFVRLAAGFDPSAADRMRARVWRVLADAGIQQGDPSTWPSGRLSKADGSRRLQGERVFDAFWSREVVAAIDALLGAGAWKRPSGVVDLLLTFPDPEQPLSQLDPFHSDFAMDVPHEPLFAVNVFVLVGAVAPSGGGTLLIRGSHRVVQRYLDALPPGFPRNRAASQFAADNPWLKALGASGSPVGATHDVDGFGVCVEEMTGNPGDVVLTHPWMLHAGVTSHGTAPRMMLRHRIMRTALGG